jgi:hypothetical protein
MTKVKRWRPGKSGVFQARLRHAKITLHGVSFKYEGRRLRGLTGPTGLLRPRYYPYFNRERATDVGLSDRGVPLKWAPAVAHRHHQHPSTRAEAMERRIGRGMARGNALSAAVAIMVTMANEFGVPVREFSASHRAQRVPKVMTLKGLTQRYPSLAANEPAAKACLSALNTTRPHLPLFAQKTMELQIDWVAYELPCAHGPYVGLTAADVVGVHHPTGAIVFGELKTGGGAYTLLADGQLAAPFQSLPSCVLTQHFLQLAYTFDWAKRTYPRLAPSFSIPLLIRVSPSGCWHQALPAVFRTTPLPTL